MRRLVRTVLFATTFLTCLGIPSAWAQTISEFPLPGSSPGATEIVAGSDGALWFIESGRNRIGRITTSGVATDFDLGLPTASQVAGIAKGPDGNIWFTAGNLFATSYVGKVTPGGTVTRYTLYSSLTGPDGIAAGSDGALWFTIHNGGGGSAGVLGAMGADGTFSGPWGPVAFPLNYPTRITAGTGSAVWLADQFSVGLASAYSKIVRWDVAAHTGFEYSIPTSSGPVTDLCLGPDGNIWFVSGGGLPSGGIGYITPFGEVGITPAVGWRIASGSDGALWFTDPVGRMIRRMTRSGVMSSFVPPSSSGGLAGITTGPDGNIWYADGVRIGRVNISAPPQTLSIPAAASIHGAAGAFFHTDLWLTNRSFTDALSVTATYYCYLGTGCYGGQRTLSIPPRQTSYLQDVVGTLFSAPETAGPIQLSYPNSGGPLTAFARVYTPSIPAPTFGASIEAVPASAAKTRALLSGLASNGGDLSSGFRTNVGLFNPSQAIVNAVLTLQSGSGQQIGTPKSVSVPARGAVQLNDVFAALGAPSVVTNSAVLIVTASASVFPYATVIDNQSGDFVYVPVSDDEAAPQ